jgi:hypothetical protein
MAMAEDAAEAVKKFNGRSTADAESRAANPSGSGGGRGGGGWSP